MLVELLAMCANQVLKYTQNLYAELTFVCPSYWMVEAYGGQGRTAYKYQYSALPATHGADVRAYFGPLGGVPSLGEDYQRAFVSKWPSTNILKRVLTIEEIWGNFVIQQDSSISNEFTAGTSLNGTAGTNAASMWPAFSIAEPYQLDLNQTGGVLSMGSQEVGSAINTTYLTGSTRRNDFTLVDAYTWE